MDEIERKKKETTEETRRTLLRQSGFAKWTGREFLYGNQATEYREKERIEKEHGKDKKPSRKRNAKNRKVQRSNKRDRKSLHGGGRSGYADVT